MEISQQLTEEFNLRPDHVRNILQLLDEGNTIPFIARYRKEMTGAIDDQVLRALDDRYEYLKNLEKRKQEVANSITEQGKMTEEIQTAIAAAQTMTEVEDIYRPFKQRKRRGLPSLSKRVYSRLRNLFLRRRATLTRKLKSILTKKRALQPLMTLSQAQRT